MAILQADINISLFQCTNALKDLSKDELQDLCNDSSNAKFDEIVNNSTGVKNLESERDMLMASVRSIAEFNLERQSDYESDRSKLLTLVSDSNKLKEDIQTKATKLLELSKKTSLKSTLAVVLEATTQTEEESESIAKSFLDRSIDYDTFVAQYCDKRKLAHLRRIKADRLRQETE